MNIWQIGVIVFNLCIGICTLIKLVKIDNEVREYIGNDIVKEKVSKQNIVYRVLKNLFILLVASFCPILNLILLFGFRKFVEESKEEIREEFIKTI